MNAQDWLAYSCAQEYIPEEDSARVHCRFPDDTEVLCGIIANVVGGISSTQVFVAGISYSNGERISEFDELYKLSTEVIKDGNWNAIRRVVKDSLRLEIFTQGRKRTYRISRALRDKISGISGTAGVKAVDIYLMRWWTWFFDFIELEDDLKHLKDFKQVERNFETIKHAREEMQSEITFWKKFLA